MLNKGKVVENEYYYQVDCEEEQQRLAAEQEEKEKFINGLKRYSERGIPVFIDDKEPKEEKDWEKLTMIREDQQFYMGDFVSDPDTGRLKEIRFDMVYHGELLPENGYGHRKRRKKRGSGGIERY